MGLALFCPVTRRAKGYPFEVPIPGDLPAEGVILADQIRSLDWGVLRAERMGTLSDETVAELLARIQPLLQ